MNRTIQPAPVRRSVTVKASQARAFEVFTSKIGAWWPKSHHIGAADPETSVIEPKVGGDGSSAASTASSASSAMCWPGTRRRGCCWPGS